MRRHILGVLALLGMTVAVWLYYSTLDEFWSRTFAFMCFRVGLVLGAIWLALPQITQIFGRTPPWLIPACAAGLLLVMFSKSVFVLVPIFAALGVMHFVGWLFKPLPKKQRPHDRSTSSKRGNHG